MAGTEKEELKLNTLHRFVKKSPNLVLEQFSHCEVPAGCGGVVLRWRDPDDGAPLAVRASLPGAASYFLDGESVRHNAITLKPGRHLLAIHVRDVEGPTATVIAMTHDTPEHYGRKRLVVPSSVSSGDGSWLASQADPGSDWQLEAYDDGGWLPLREIDVPTDDELSARRWWFERIVELGATPVALPQAEQVWIRKWFVLEEGFGS